MDDGDDFLGDLFDEDLFADTLLSAPAAPTSLPQQQQSFFAQPQQQHLPNSFPLSGAAPLVGTPSLAGGTQHQPPPQQQQQQHQQLGCESNPALGLRVLLVDDDAVVLRVLEQMLRMCQYAVTSCTSGTSAVALLRSQPDGFDLVLCDVMMPDMDGFKLLEIVGLEMDLPVIMISGNGDTETVLRGVTHGAVDFLIKPVRIEELRNMWQHVMRRRLEMEPVGIDSSDDDLSMDEGDPPLVSLPAGHPDQAHPDFLGAMPMDTGPTPPMGHAPAQLAPKLPAYPPPPPMIQSSQPLQPQPPHRLPPQQQQQQQQQGLQGEPPPQMPIAPPPPPTHASKKPSKGGKSAKASHKKRKDSEGVEEGNASKKPRVIWSMDMHQQFVNAVNQLGVDKAVPRKILDLMDIGGLTRENVASHLQKYRLYLKKVGENPNEQFTH